MERFEHGGDVYTYTGVLDYSANLNPLGMPAAAKEALLASIDTFDVYPDPSCSRLVRAIADFEHVPCEWVVPCAGATDAITRLCMAAALDREDGRALVCAPCYSGYEQALEQAGMPIVRHALREEDGMNVTARILDSITDEVGLVFLANPNNPTGLCLDHNLIEAVLARAEEVEALVALDECFIDLSLESGSNDLLERYGNLVIVKALTKTFALAGLRVGYALCSSEGVRALMASLGQMWAVSTPAQVAGVAALKELDYVEAGRQMVARERERLAAVLEARGMQVVPGQSNYLMFKDPQGCRSNGHDGAEGDGYVADGGAADGGAADGGPRQAEDEKAERARFEGGSEGTGTCPTAAPTSLYDALLERSILIRRCENYHGLTGTWYRIAVRSPEENDRFVSALKEVRP